MIEMIWLKEKNELILKNWLKESSRINRYNNFVNANYESEKEYVKSINDKLRDDYNKALDKIKNDREEIKKSIDNQISDVNKRNKEIDLENASRKKEVELENERRKKQNADDTLEKEAKLKQKEENDKLLSEYKIKLSEWEAKKAEYDKKSAEYDVALEVYNRKKKAYEEELHEYEKALIEREKIIAANKESDKKVNDENKKKIAEIAKRNEANAKELGYFVSNVRNALVFEDEPDAIATVEINRSGDTGGYGLIKADGVDRAGHIWSGLLDRLTEENLNDDYLAKNNLTNTVKLSWDENFNALRLFGGNNYLTYPVIAKKNRPFTVTYTNLKNSTYNGKKISKIEYVYEVLETGSFSDFMVVDPAKNPTISVSIYGRMNDPNHRTRVKITPKFYLEDDSKIIPTADKPFMFSLLSMNAKFDDLSYGVKINESLARKIKELHPDVSFSEGEYGKGGYVHGMFEKKYGIKWNDRDKDGFYSKVKSEWEALEKSYLEEYSKFEKEVYDSYGPDKSKWPSNYREIVYKINNGEFIKINGSFVGKHDDGIYSDKNVDDAGFWDSPTAEKNYLGAGVVKVTDDNFSMEFGSTTPVTQLFTFSTRSINNFIGEEVPKYVDKVTPEPPLVNGPNEIEKFEKTRPVFNEVKPEPPVFKELDFKPKEPRIMVIDPNELHYIPKSKDVPNIYKVNEPKLGEVLGPDKKLLNIDKPVLEDEVGYTELYLKNTVVKPTFELKKTIYEYVNISSASSLNVQSKVLKKVLSFADSFTLRKLK